MQHGNPTLVPRDCVGDRARVPPETNLFDIDAKYADVVPLDAVLAYLEDLPCRSAIETLARVRAVQERTPRSAARIRRPRRSSRAAAELAQGRANWLRP
jgi:hypothetical protein